MPIFFIEFIHEGHNYDRSIFTKEKYYFEEESFIDYSRGRVSDANYED